MKFEYDTDGFEDCVAFIDANGNLVVYTRDGKVCFCGDGLVHTSPYTHDTDAGTKRKFYRGDKITITF